MKLETLKAFLNKEHDLNAEVKIFSPCGLELGISVMSSTTINDLTTQIRFETFYVDNEYFHKTRSQTLVIDKDKNDG